MENGGNSYRIGSEEKKDPAGVRAGCKRCEGQIWDVLVPGGCPWAPRHQQPGSPSVLQPWKRQNFSPNQLPRGTGTICSLSLAKAKPYPCPQRSAWVSQGCSRRLAPSPTFPSPLPSFFSTTSLPYRRRLAAPSPSAPKWATRADYCRGSSAFSLLPVLPAPPRSAPQRSAAGAAPAPGERGPRLP